ncbi:uncharacterized protein LOC134177506 [Corticium candelabrum]|uniref:uncharacterized protein LOC134177506 n=1 Tax=Corticium candelabrum TaxID=121492 RepID=UPI002E25DEFC|nr:uncharacterized protein LOC134177506 [Corticium candelabrum]
MFDKHLTFHLFVFRVSIVVAILESVASGQTVLCQTDSKDVLLYEKNITLYSLVGSNFRFLPHRFPIFEKSKYFILSDKYSWTVNVFETNFIYQWPKAVKTSNETKYRTIFKMYYRNLKVNGITEEYDGVRLRYTVVLPNFTIFHSKTATLRVGDLPTISEQSTIIWSESNSRVKTCFNITGSPKPSLKMNQQANKIVNSSVEIDESCVYFVFHKGNNAGKFTVTAENCFGQSNITISVPNVQSTLSTENSKIYTPPVSTSNVLSTLTRSESPPVSLYLIGATTQNTAEEESNTTSSGFPSWAYAIISIFSIAAVTFFLLPIILYVRKNTSYKAASQHSNNGAVDSSNPTNEGSSHVYEYITNEDQVRQVRLESSYVEPFNFAIQENPAYGAAV